MFSSMLRDSWMSFGIIVTWLPWIAHKLVFSKRPDQTGLTCLLQSTNSGPPEVQTCFEVLSNFLHQTLEGKFGNQRCQCL